MLSLKIRRIKEKGKKKRKKGACHRFFVVYLLVVGTLPVA
jgi:hypothetical protein